MALFNAAKNGDVDKVRRYWYVDCSDPDGRTPLHFACIYGHTKLGEVLVQELKVDVHKKDSKGLTPLQYACIKEHMDIVKTILVENSKASMIVRDQSGRIPLHYACECGHLDIIKLLPLKLTDLAMQDSNGQTALMLAARGGHLDCVLSLLHYCQYNHMTMLDNNGWTVLHHACAGGSTRIVEILITDYKFDINLLTLGNDTPLHVAVRAQRLAIVLALISNSRCNPNLINVTGQTVLHLACKRGDRDIICALLRDCKVDVNICDKNKNTPLHVALKTQQYKVASAMINHTRCDLNALDGNGQSVLHLACRSSNSIEVVQTLLCEGKVDVNVCNKCRDTPLHVALKAQQHQVVFALISHPRCDFNALNDDGQSVLHLACKSGNLKVVRTLLCDCKANINARNSVKDTSLHVALKAQQYKVASAMISHTRCDLNALDGNGQSVLHLACKGGNIQVVKTLLSQHKIYVNVYNEYRDMPLHVALKAQQFKVASAMINHTRCELNALDGNGQSVLHLACMSGNIQVVLTLLRKGQVDVNAHNSKKDTPLHVALKAIQYEVVFALISHYRCNSNVLDGNGQSVLHLACNSGTTRVVETLLCQDKVDVNVCNISQDTPLHVALKAQQYQVVFALISNNRCNLNVLDGNGQSVLHLACTSGNIEVVRSLLWEDKVDVNYLCNSKNDTPLHLALKSQQVSAPASYSRCNPNALDGNGQSVLHLACKSGNVQVIKTLVLSNKVDVNISNSKKNTPLHTAFNAKQYQALLALVSHSRCNPNVLDGNGQSVLHLACKSGNVQVIKTLVLSNKVDVNISNSKKNTPLHTAFNAKQYQALLALVSHSRCNSNVLDGNGQSVLHLACKSGNIQVIQTILNKVDVNVSNSVKDTPLHVAFKAQQYQVVSALISNPRCNSNALDGNGQSVLHLACESGNAEVVNMFLCEDSADINVCNREKDTPLHVATNAGCFAIVHALLERSGCDSSAKGKFGRNALHVASKKGYNDITEVLVKFISPLETDNDGNTPLHMACESGNLEVVQTLLHEEKVDLNACNKRLNTPLHIALNAKVVLALISHSRCNVNVLDGNGQSVLHLACKSCNIEIVQTLLREDKVDVNLCNREKDTPLHVATNAGCFAIVHALLKRSGCDSSAKGKFGRNALHVASKKGYNDISQALVKFISPLETDDYGNTPLHMASEHTHTDVISLLLHDNAPVLIRNKRGLTPIDLACCKHSKILFENYCRVNHQKIQSHYTEALEKAKCRYFGAHYITRVFVLGDSGAGKSSLIESLKREKFFESRWKVSESSVPPHTAGIIPSVHVSNDYGRILFYDFAGDAEYYSSHAAIFECLASSKKGNNIFVIVVDLRKDDVIIETTLNYWISFIRFQKFQKLSLVVVGSHLDQSSKSLDKFCAISLPNVQSFKHFTLDCRDPRSNQIVQFKKWVITRVSESEKYDISTEASLLLGLLEMDFHQVIACPVQILTKHIKDSGSWLPAEPKALQRLLSELHEVGVLLLLGDCTKDSDYIVLNIPKLTNEVHELLFSRKSPISSIIGELDRFNASLFNIGILPKDVHHCLPKHITTECLTHLQYCQEISKKDLAIFDSKQDDIANQSVFFFPALCSADKPEVLSNQYAESSFSINFLALCIKQRDYFPSRFLHVLLLRLVYGLTLPVPTELQASHSSPEHSRRCTMWKKGVHWKMEEGVDCMVELVSGRKGVAVCLKSSCDGTEECVRVFKKLVSCVMEAKAEFCHSIKPQFFLLDSCSDEADYLNKDHLFAFSDIKRTLESPLKKYKIITSVSGKREIQLSKLQYMYKLTHWNSLFPINYDDVLHILKNIVKDLYEFGLQLGAPSHVLDEIEINFPDDVGRRRRELVKWWMNSLQHFPCWWHLIQALRSIHQNILAEVITKEHDLHIQLQEKMLVRKTHALKPDEQFLRSLSSVIGSRWPFVAVSLGLDDTEVERLKLQVMLSQQELAFQMLKVWTLSEEATYGQLCHKLKAISLFQY